VHAIDRVPIHRDQAGPAGPAGLGVQALELSAGHSLEPLDIRHHRRTASPCVSTTL
jgi:hypothetical protein